MRTAFRAIAAITFLFGFNADFSLAAGFECPRLDELVTPPLSVEIDDVVPKGLVLDEPSQLASAIILLREHGLSTDNTINHLIALYCPGVAAENSLTDQQKTDRVAHFARQAASLVFSTNSADDIIFDVPLAAAVARAARVQAKKDGLSVEAWIAKTVDSAIP
jgi:hypothetical protein